MYGFNQQAWLPQQQRQELIRVTGIEGARAYQMPPNSVVALFDANDMLLYIKATDGAGFATITDFRIERVNHQPEPTNAPDPLRIDLTAYATKEDLEALRKELANGQYIRPATNNQQGKQSH